MRTADEMTLVVMTPEKTMLEIPVGMVSLPGSKGRFAVLKNHAPLISSLEEGDVVYVSEGVEGRMQITSGFVEVKENRITVCAEL